MKRESIYDRYASLILETQLKIKEGDVLSINTEEEDYYFARLLSKKAKEITNNGSYIQLLKNGRIVDEFDIFSDFPLKKRPTLFVYLPLYKKQEEVDLTKKYLAKDLQRFSLLSDPIDNSEIRVPFITCPLPSPEWDSEIKEMDISEDSLSLLSSILSLEESNYQEINRLRNENIVYLTGELNKMKLGETRVYNDEGTDLSFSFLKDSIFISSFTKTHDGRYFSPSIISCDIFRLIDFKTVNGWLNTTRPIFLWGKKISNISLYFESGRVKDIRGNKNDLLLLEHYSRQDERSLLPSMLTLSEREHPLYDNIATLYPNLDRQRTLSLTLGGPKGEAVSPLTLEKTVDSLVTLSLPFGSDSTQIIAIDGSGEEKTIYSDGYIITD